jgi:hypothetical protein
MVIMIYIDVLLYLTRNNAPRALPLMMVQVLHAKLEPRDISEAVPVVAISNWELDRSKMNRAMILGCPQPDDKDLVEIALAIIRFYLFSTSPGRQALERAVQQLASQFQNLLTRQDPKDFHGLRDWYGMCAQASRLLAEADSIAGYTKAQELTTEGASLATVASSGLQAQASALVKLHREHRSKTSGGLGWNEALVPTEWALHLAVVANFSGNGVALDTARLYDTSRRGGGSSSTRGNSNCQAPVVNLLALQPSANQPCKILDSLLADTGGRHVMVITRSPGPIIAWICLRASELAGWNPEALVGSPLELNQTSEDMHAQSMLQAAIVSIAQERRLLVLHNLSAIYAALYDVFNANYSRGGGVGSQKYCRIARAGFCNPRCAVAEHFKAVLVVTPERAAQYEPALLNRFAKVEVELADLLQAFDGEGAEQKWLREAQTSWLTIVEDSYKGVDPGLSRWLPTDVVAGCPPQLLEVVSLSAQITAHSLGRKGVAVDEISEQLFTQLLTMEQIPRTCEPKPTFGSLVEAARRRSAACLAKHTVMPMLVMTFSDPEHWSVDIAKSLSGVQAVTHGVAIW